MSNGGICELKLLIFLFTLQAVKRSHRRLGLAQKLMEQVECILDLLYKMSASRPNRNMDIVYYLYTVYLENETDELAIILFKNWSRYLKLKFHLLALFL